VYYAVKYLNHNLDNELILMRDYKLNPTELFVIKIILLAQDGEYEYLQQFNEILNGQLRLLLESLQSKGIIIKAYKIPKEGTSFIPEDVQFNQNFLKKYYRSAYEMGEELFNTYPQSAIVGGVVYNLRSVSKRFDSLETAFQKYAKIIKNNPELHQQILDDIRWGIENEYQGFTTLDRFIIDRGYEFLHSMRQGKGTNLNLEATQLI
jgi:hypothetical protein